MRGKLSHSSGRPGSHAALRSRRPSDPRRARPGPARALILIALAAWVAGCNRIEADAIQTQAAETSGAEASGTAAPPAPFAWPEDPSHPVLQVEVASPSSQGTILIELMPDLSPVTVAHVIDLAKDGYYDGTTFHRVIPGFMIQGGDPNSRDRNPHNDGLGAPNDQFADEFGPAPFVRGVVGMGNKGRANSNTPQFFIMQSDNPSLTGRYTVIGRVVRGMELVDEITKSTTDKVGRWGPKDRPIENIVMESVSIAGPLAALGLEPAPTDRASVEAEDAPAAPR